MSDDQDNNVISFAEVAQVRKPASSDGAVTTMANHSHRLRFGTSQVLNGNGKLMFEANKNGVKALVEKYDINGNLKHSRMALISGPLRLRYEGRTPEHGGWVKFFQLINGDGEIVEVAIPTETLSGDGAKLRAILMEHGLYVSAKRYKRELLLEYVARCRTEARVTLVGRVGWFGDVYATASGVIGVPASRQEIRYVGRQLSKVGQKGGTFEAWQNEVAKPCVGNPLLVFALSVAFAGPLLRLVKAEGSLIFHYVGPSSKGKSTALAMAGSVYGGGDNRPNVQSWRATTNGLEGVMAAHNDALVCLDELGVVNGKEVGIAAYMIGDGKGKVRSNSTGAARPIAVWLCAVLSSGEITLEAKMREDDPKRHVAAGQRVRVIDISADAGQGLGVFTTLGDVTDPAQLAISLNKAAITHHGHAGSAFIEKLALDIDQLTAEVMGTMGTILAGFKVPPDADGQIKRVAQKFALVGAAGILATRLGIVPWPENEAQKAATQLFGTWLAARGGTRPQEEAQALELVRYYIMSRPKSFHEETSSSPDSSLAAMAGFIKKFPGDGKCYCFPKEIWERDVCKGLDPRLVAATLREHGLLATDAGRKTKTVRLGKHKIHVFAVKETLLAEIDDTADISEAGKAMINRMFPDKQRKLESFT